MKLQRSLHLPVLIWTLFSGVKGEEKKGKIDFEEELSQGTSIELYKPKTEDNTMNNPHVLGQAGIPISKYDLGYEIPFEQSAALKNDPKAISDYFLLNDIHLLGVSADISADNFSHTSTRTTSIWTTVRYIQTFQRIPVYGTDLAVTVNQNNVITIVLGKYMEDVSISDPQPLLTQEDVDVLIAQRYVKGNNDRIESSSPELVIFQAVKESLLAWKIKVSFKDDGVSKSFEILIRDEDSSIILENDLILTNSSAKSEGNHNRKKGGKNLRR